MRFFTVSLVVFLGACGGNAGENNVAACEDWLESTTCGDFDFGASLNCAIYKETTCDISAYFDCLTDNTVCDEGVADISGWASCATQAVCD